MLSQSENNNHNNFMANSIGSDQLREVRSLAQYHTDNYVVETIFKLQTEGLLLNHYAIKNTRLGVMKYAFSPHSVINSPSTLRQVTKSPQFAYL